MDPGLVTAVIPTYNYGQFVAEAVASVLAQTYSPTEVIVVDDGSTDDTKDRLTPFQDRVRYVYQDNQGLSAARNTGIRSAKGEFLVLLDSDDLLHPRMLEILIPLLKKDPDAALVASDSVTNWEGRWPDITSLDHPATTTFTIEDLALKSRFGPSGAVIRRQCFDAVGLFDVSLRSAEDRDMWLRLAARYRLLMLQLPLWFYRLHGGNMSRAARRMEENEFRVLERAFSAEGPLRNRRLLKRKALSYACFSAAYMYREAGDTITSLSRMVRSLVLWPVPYPRKDVKMPLARARLLLSILRRCFGKQAAASNRCALT